MSIFPHILKYAKTGGLFRIPSNIGFLDAAGQYFVIDGTDVSGNPLDFGRTDPFSFAAVVYPIDRNNIRLFEKRNANSGYVLGTTTDGLIFAGFNTASGLQGIRAASGYNFPTDPFTIFIATYDGSGSTNGFAIHQYRNNASFSATISSGSGTSVPLGATGLGAATLKNNVQIRIGRNYAAGTDLRTTAGVAHLSAWNKTLSKSEADDLAMKMTTDNVTNHSSYPANCVSYWRDFYDVKAQNAVNNVYNISFTL